MTKTVQQLFLSSNGIYATKPFDWLKFLNKLLTDILIPWDLSAIPKSKW
jgi:hypothetical protein